MKKELIENAANSYAGIARPSFVNGEFDRNAIADAFEYGAHAPQQQVVEITAVQPLHHKLAVF